MTLKAFMVCFLVVVIMTPTLVVGFAVTPWFFLLLFGLLLIFPFVLAPRVDKSSGTKESSDGLARVVLVASLVLSGFIFALGLLLAPWFFLLILLICAPLLWLGFRA